MRDRPDAKNIQHVRLTELSVLRELASRALTGVEDCPFANMDESANQHLGTWVEVPLRQMVQLIDELQKRIKPEESDG